MWNPSQRADLALIPAHAVWPALGGGAGCPRTRRQCAHDRTADDPRRFGGLEGQSPGTSVGQGSREVGHLRLPRLELAYRCVLSEGAGRAGIGVESLPKSRPRVDSSPRRLACPRLRSRLSANPQEVWPQPHRRRPAPVRGSGGQSPGASFVLVSRLRPCPAPRRTSRATPWTTTRPTPGQSDTSDDARGQGARQPGARRPSRAERPRLPLTSRQHLEIAVVRPPEVAASRGSYLFATGALMPHLCPRAGEAKGL